MSNQNPYSKAAGAYGLVTGATDQRTLEGTVLLQAAEKLEEVARRLQSGEKLKMDEIGDALTHNRKLWQLFVGDMHDPEHPLPQEIKNNIASLALFIFKRTHEILIEARPEKFKTLISINRSIAAGLMKKPAVSAPVSQKAPAERATTDKTA